MKAGVTGDAPLSEPAEPEKAGVVAITTGKPFSPEEESSDGNVFIFWMTVVLLPFYLWPPVKQTLALIHRDKNGNLPEWLR